MEKHIDAPDTPAWHARRATCWNAGDAAAMLGCSSNKTRTQLLQEQHTGLQREFSDYVQERVLDPGHAIEAAMRPRAEAILDDELQVLAGTLVVEGLSRPLGASLDGITFMEDTVWECKSLNEDLRAVLPNAGRDSAELNDAKRLPKMYRAQMEQQLLVTGAERTLFSAADGPSVQDERHAWYYPDPALRAEILAGWAQFERDLETYQPTTTKEMPRPEVTLALPALVIHAKGEITTSNMKEYGVALAKRLAEVRSIALVSDQDFSNAKDAAKQLREEIEKGKLVKAAMLAQTVTVGEAARMIDAWCEDMRLTALQLEKDVEREDRAKKVAMIAAARSAYEQHIETAKADTGGPWILLTSPNWVEAIKGKRNYASMQDALDTMLANAKIEADKSARGIRAALAALDEVSEGYTHLFADRLGFIHRSPEDVRTLARARITEHRAAEERRAAELAEQARAKIRQEEEAKAQAKARAEQQEREAAERRQREETEAQARRQEQEAAARAEQQRQAEVAVTTPAVTTNPPIGNVRPMPTKAPAAAATPPTLRLGQINERIAPLSVDAAGLASLGIPHSATDKSAKLWHEHQFAAIVDALIGQLARAKLKQLEAA